MKSKLILATIAGSLLVSTGCTKSRWFTRRDYSEMQDPFMDSNAVADADADATAAPRSGLRDQTGRARLDSGPASTEDAEMTADARPLIGPKPIQQVGSTNNGGLPSRPVTNAMYPGEEKAAAGTASGGQDRVLRSHEGPALSDFLRQRNTGAASQANSEQPAHPSAGALAPQTVERLPSTGRLPSRTQTAAVKSPAAQAAELNTVSNEVEDFSNFLQSGAATARAVGTAASETAAQSEEAVSESAGDFADFAARKKAEWSDQATAAPAAARESLRQAGRSAQSMADEFVMSQGAASAGTDSEEVDESESAQPLLRSPAGSTSAASTRKPATPAPTAAATASTKKPAAPAAKSKTPAKPAHENPFEAPLENPFDEIPSNAEDGATESGGNSGGLDDSFGIDSGWKPSTLSPP